mgnify:CR=1 FL=1
MVGGWWLWFIGQTLDLTHAVEKLVQTTLRSIIGDMGLDDTLASREEIERGLKTRINNVCKNWGLNIYSVELLEITPTKSVQDAMHKQLAAERIRRAAIVTAEGFREQTKTEAEGATQAEIAMAGGQQRVAVLRAKGTSDARLLIAKAEAQAVTTIASALREYGVNASQYAIALKYINAFEAVATSASRRTLYFPYEVRCMLGVGGVVWVVWQSNHRHGHLISASLFDLLVVLVVCVCRVTDQRVWLIGAVHGVSNRGERPRSIRTGPVRQSVNQSVSSLDHVIFEHKTYNVSNHQIRWCLVC